jgi:apolipoprotein N-acyltransferase
MKSAASHRFRPVPADRPRETTEQPPPNGAAAPVPPAPSFRTTFGLAALGGFLLWLAFPPWGLWPLAWLAPLPWLRLVTCPAPLERRHYWALGLAGFLHWAALLQGIRLAHPALYPGWLVLSAYLGLYLPLFVGMSRSLTHRWQWPLVIAAPVVWVGLELARGYLVTGFSLALLSHSQTPVPLLLQTADLVGPYGPGFVMVFVAAAVVVGLTPASRRVRTLSLAAAFTLLLALLGYGGYRMPHTSPVAAPTARVMLVQGCVDTVLDGNPDRPREMMEHYRGLTFEHLPQHPSCDLVVWPESAFTHVEYRAQTMDDLPASFSPSDYEQYQAEFGSILSAYAEQINQAESGRTHFLVGGTSLELQPNRSRVFNAALLLSPDGKIGSRYFKKHLVMFGEYIPLGEWFPIIYQLTPMPGGLARGGEFTSFEAAGLSFAPSICFESTVPQLIRQQVNTLASKGREPAVLINTTNDGWFYGSSILDLHFQCAVLRAIENRKPFLIAANTGISGVIDGSGRVQQRGPSHDTAVLVAEVQPDGRRSLYRTLGDWPAALCAAVVFLALLAEFGSWWRSSRRS